MHYTIPPLIFIAEEGTRCGTGGGRLAGEWEERRERSLVATDG